MESRLDKVHISYKHDDEYKEALGAIRAGLEKSGIPYSIDTYDILYRDSIDEYEKEIGKADRVIMFVIPNYFRSLDCMFEMTQMFMCGISANGSSPLWIWEAYLATATVLRRSKSIGNRRRCGSWALRRGRQAARAIC